MRPITSSEISCFQRCEREWQHRYLERRDVLVPAEALARGRRIHESLSYFWTGYRVSEVIGPPIEAAMILGYYARWQSPRLSNVQTSVAWRANIGGIDVVGELDAIGEQTTENGWSYETVIVEHKTTSSDITTGSLWWREKVTTDIQISMYQAAFPKAKILVDVLRVPEFEQLSATPEDQRKYTKPTKKEPVSRLYANQRDRDETDEEYIARCLEDMADKPEKYFQRALVVRLEEEHRAFALDIQRIASRMQVRLQTPRNPRSCFSYGRQCDFFAACWEGKSIEDYPQRELNHSEEVASRYR